jgi:putative membrane protein insertion efficiency factor
VNHFGPHQNPHQQQPPPRRRGWLRRNWPWYDRYCTARDIRRAQQGRRGRRNNDSDGCDFCDGCGCDLFHLSTFQILLLAAPTRAPRRKVTVPARAGLGAIRGYQRWVSHRLPTCCPHTPSCSHYGLAVVRRYGLFQGARLAGGRIARCTPTVPRGTADPPP